VECESAYAPLALSAHSTEARQNQVERLTGHQSEIRGIARGTLNLVRFRLAESCAIIKAESGP